MNVEQRLADIRARYGPEDPVSRALVRSAPLLSGAVARVTRKLAECSPPPRIALPARVRVLVAAT
jgi:hypothetical protein